MWFRSRVTEQTAQNVSVSRGEKKDLNELRFEVFDYFVSLNSTWTITNYVMRSWTLSEFFHGRKNGSAKRIVLEYSEEIPRLLLRRN